MASDAFVFRNIRIILFVVALMTAGAAHADNDCFAETLPPLGPFSEALKRMEGLPYPVDWARLRDQSKVLLPAQLDGITSDMPTAAILKRLGPAARDGGSGLFVLEWDVTDGRTFFISTASACEEKPRAVGFRWRPLPDKKR